MSHVNARVHSEIMGKTAESATGFMWEAPIHQAFSSRIPMDWIHLASGIRLSDQYSLGTQAMPCSHLSCFLPTTALIKDPGSVMIICHEISLRWYDSTYSNALLGARIIWKWSYYRTELLIVRSYPIGRSWDHWLNTFPCWCIIRFFWHWFMCCDWH